MIVEGIKTKVQRPAGYVESSHRWGGGSRAGLCQAVP
jgi:hypothetical protein